MYGSSNSSGGGLFDSNGVYGGYGNYRDHDPVFGQGGLYEKGTSPVADGGFGGGGGERYSYNGDADGGDGGFGGGAGASSSYYYAQSGGQGGFGGGGDTHANRQGFGATRFGAAMGGAVFIRTGAVAFENVAFIENEAFTHGELKGVGGADLIVQPTTQVNQNNQGMPTVLANVTGCDMTFSNNIATEHDDSSNNDHDIFDVANRFDNQGECYPDLIFEDGFD